METSTTRLSKYVKEKGIAITVLSKNTHISYQKLYDSISNKKSNRELKADEFLKICVFLEVDPLKFVDREEG